MPAATGRPSSRTEGLPGRLADAGASTADSGTPRGRSGGKGLLDVGPGGQARAVQTALAQTPTRGDGPRAAGRFRATGEGRPASLRAMLRTRRGWTAGAGRVSTCPIEVSVRLGSTRARPSGARPWCVRRSRCWRRTPTGWRRCSTGGSSRSSQRCVPCSAATCASRAGS